MLYRLKIENYALIRNLELEFDKGLSIITGETGAGKSIMLGALSLLSGQRGETRFVGKYGQKAVVEGEFSSSPSLDKLLESNGVECSDDNRIIIRRELSASGRSRAFVNDTPVNLQFLTLLSSGLIDIHSQHGNSLLRDSNAQLQIIDAYAGTGKMLETYRAGFNRYVALRSRIRKAQREYEESRQNRQLIAMQLEELDALNPKAGEFALIEREYDRLSAADEIRSALGVAVNVLGEGENSALQNVRLAKSSLDVLDKGLLEEEANEEGLTDRLESVAVELKDIVDTLERFASDVESNPARLEKVAARMKAYMDARRHFHVDTCEDLVALREKLRARSRKLISGREEIDELEAKARELAPRLKEEAARISDLRKEGARKLEQQLVASARTLGLPNIRFEIAFEESKLTADGGDVVDFLCSFNKNGDMLSVGKVASGGEISRLMLCLKGIMAGHIGLPTIIFDEIDTGVSGEIADRMGEMMKDMSSVMQVMTITHLPQVAAKGDVHFKVSKHDTADYTETNIVPLSADSRVEEIARMLSGSEITSVAMENARWLLGNKTLFN